MKLTDYIAEFLVNEGITHTFGVTGGAVVHFFDSLSKTPKITPIFNHHRAGSCFSC